MKVTVVILLVNFINVVKSRNFRIPVVNPLNDERDKDDSSPKAKWVKRIIPHDYKSAPFEYDNKLNTLFVPKYRIEKKIDLNTKPELASTVFLQPFKGFQETNKENFKDLLKAFQNTVNRDDQDDRKTQYYITSKAFDGDKNNRNVADGNTYKIQNIDYEKPWQQVDIQYEPSERHHRNKQEPYFENMDTLLKTVQSSTTKRKRNPKGKYSVYSDGPVWQTMQKNPRQQERIISYTINDILQKLKSTELEKPRKKQRYLKNTQTNSADLLVPYTMLMLKNEKSKTSNDFKFLKLKQNSHSAEPRQGMETLTDDLENTPDKKPIVEAVKHIDAILDGLENNEDKVKLKNKTKLLFKSMSTYFLNKHNLLNNPSSGFKRVRDSRLASHKPNKDSDLLVSDILNELANSQKPKPDLVDSDELWESILTGMKQTQSGNLGKLLKRLRDLNDESHSEETHDSSAEEHYWTPNEPAKKQRVTKLEDLLKRLVGMQESWSSENESDSPNEPEWPFEVIQKHKVQLLLPALNKNEPPSVTKYENPSGKLHFYVRSLEDLVKILNYMEGTSRKDPQLRDRPTNTVVLDYGQSLKQHPFNFPHYSMWNYWTYDKNLFHDNCPGEQAKVGNKCIWTPPHRK